MTIAVFPGSFDPLTNGHLDLIERASRMFDQLIVAVGQNTAKRGVFTASERVAFIETEIAGLDNVSVQVETGLTVDFMRSVHATVLVRGLRNSTDFEFEQGIAGMNRTLAAEMDTVCLMAAPKYQFVSSSLLKEVAQFGGDLTSLVPPAVAEGLRDRLERE
ncbi:pantetheine-phosphate adenylyltransferase [Levilactobacillus tujiorum]|uniref:Phosphopantetheine adenylyltransferase n=1 Tax=Levilactobacillus tujiorum TaxID=2912243 RepID=A0ABX1L5X8_9LACO|nr:pantetheine-phosphate adenylyltransferase [Levilactobacillus tujiorum]MCH5465412.1 pantetheine-phosphate adenylyltransferase [Levilactobacillus tujiorum]NLR12452.1 pantetheine-phosphate adenylyltransferase [Lactobacillus sp. HBUAS51387]NLR30465.1 pantetheine-phosphate adenylyltransferase [Levilactobacillus tujiorum]